MKFSNEIGESLTLKFAESARELIAQGDKILSMGLGEPNFETPKYVIDSTIDALKQGYTHYSSPQGLLELRKLISQDTNTRFMTKYNANDVIVLPGVKAAIFYTLASILEPDDEVIIISPYYVSYPAMIKIAEPTAKIIDVPLDKNFELDIEVLEKAFSNNTKCIVVNSPNNPSGNILTKSELSKIADLALKFDAYIISDEVYDKLVFTDNIFTSFLEIKDITERLIVANGYSKSYGLTGWRIGYAIAPKLVMDKMIKIHQHVNTNTNTFVQKGVCSIYLNDEMHLKPYLEELENRMNIFDEFIQKSKNLSGLKPVGGFFYFANIAKTKLDSNSFCVKLLEETKIATTPGIAFGPKWDNCVRFSLAIDIEKLNIAIDLLEKFDDNIGSEK